MTIIGHLAIPTFIYLSVSGSTNHTPTILEISTLAASANFPDIDFLFHIFWKKKKYDQNFQHHNWFTHLPIFYVPLIFIALYTNNIYWQLITYGIYSHLIFDSLAAGDGIMWLYPFSKKFTNFFSSKTSGHHGINWERIFITLPIFKLELIILVCDIFWLVKLFG